MRSSASCKASAVHSDIVIRQQVACCLPLWYMTAADAALGVCSLLKFVDDSCSNVTHIPLQCLVTQHRLWTSQLSVPCGHQHVAL